MSLITVIWSSAIGASLLLAWIHFLIWMRNRHSWANLCFFFAVLSVVWLAMGEMASMRAETAAMYSNIARWQHLGNGLAMIASMAFIHFYFGTGRKPLLFFAVALRVLAVVANFTTGENLHIKQLLEIDTVSFLGEEVTILGNLIVNPWVKLGQLAALVQFIYVIDATLRFWNIGGWDRRRRALLIGMGLAVFGIYTTLHAGMMISQVIRLPLMTSLPFFVVVMGMGYELMRDMIRSSQLAQDLQESEHRLSLASDAAQFAVWEWDVVSDVIRTTKNGRQLYGVSSKERLGLAQFTETVHPDDRAMVDEAIQLAATSGRYAVDYRVVLPDGSARWIAASGMMTYNNEGKPSQLRGISIDVSERKKAESEAASLRRELAHLSRVGILGELAGSIAHELNQPLAAMLNNAQVARRNMDQPPVDLTETCGILDDIADDAKRAGGIIHGMRAMFKNDVTTVPQPVDLDECITQVISLLRNELISRKTTVEYQARAEGLIALAGRIEIQQVLLNLLLNALDALDSSNDFSSRVIVITAHAENSKAILQIRDNGPGIPNDILARLFEPLISSKPHGLGLGLSISRRITQHFGGTLTAENHPAGGALFVLSIPTAPDINQDLPSRLDKTS